MAALDELLQSSIFCLVFFSLFENGSSSNHSATKSCQEFSLGAIVDYSSRAGKEERVAMKIAIDALRVRSICPCPALRVKDSHGDTGQAINAAANLIRKHRVRAIVGLGTWQEAAAVAEIGNKSSVPVLSLAKEVPNWAVSKWPFLMQAARSEYSQMKALAAMIQTWQRRKVNIIYEDADSYTSGILPYLIHALEEVDAEIDGLSPLPPLPPYNYRSELKRIRSGQCRIFLVHASVKVASAVFREAKSLGMMEKESVWITTTETANYIDVLDASTIASMQGVLGVRSYFSHGTKKLKKFRSQFRAAFHKQYPKEQRPAPGIFALQAYDAVYSVALAMESAAPNMSSLTGQDLLSHIFNSSFKGLTGDFHFIKGRVAPADIFRIVNVVGKSCNEIGYWADGLGFAKSLGENITYSNSMSVLGLIYFPGGPRSIPRGCPTRGERLKIGVPISNSHKEFVNARNESSGGNFTVAGFSIDVFKATLKHLPYDLPYDFMPFNGSYNSLVQQITNKTFGAVVADTAIVAKRCAYGQFSQPYADSGLQIVVYVKPGKFERGWLFKKPFTSQMWAFTGIVNVYNGFVVWLIERSHNQAFRGNILNQVGTMLSLAFTTLFSLQGNRLHSNLSRMAMVVWLFMALVITQSFTASLTSFLMVQNLNPADINIESLIRSEARVGYDRNSFVGEYLQNVLGFNRTNIVSINHWEDYPEALMRGNISAAFLEVPYVKVFLARYCNGFTSSKQIFKVGGFGFVFPRSSAYLPDISEAVLKVTESGELRELENKMISSNKCADLKFEDNEHQHSLGIDSFWGLFIVTSGISTISLVLFLFQRARDNRYQHHLKGQRVHGPQEDEAGMFAPDLQYAAAAADYTGQLHEPGCSCSWPGCSLQICNMQRSHKTSFGT